MIAISAIALAPTQEGKRRTARLFAAAIAITYGEVKEIQICLRRNRTTTSMRAIS
jgi:hypothetical protein